ncbi:MAG TPA: hypothetical protein VHR41_20035 [Gemmatimonadales bacterium]|jgi:hypothetical protein|nr:hypothetical protein [Gemmatimonadales bacterium]
MTGPFVSAILLLVAVPSAVGAQAGASDGPVLRARHASPAPLVKMFNAAGSVRLVGWDRDSLLIRGRVAKGEALYLSGNDSLMKLGIEDRNDGKPMADSDLLVYLPRGSQVSLKTVTGDITASDVSGWFYTVSGGVRLNGAATTIEVQAMSGNVDLDVATPWVRARTGDGNLLVRGDPQDVDAATIGGTLSIASSAILRGQFGSVSGDVHYAGAPAAGAIFDFSSHSGAIDLLLARSVSGVFALSSVVGAIENGFAEARPIAATPHSIRLSLGRGGAQVAARTFKGTIRLRPQ